MSAATSTSSASFTKANKIRHVSLAMTVTLLAGLSAGAAFAQSAP
ncbi:tonB-system energizer ExbB, partial [Rhizobium sp. BR5]